MSAVQATIDVRLNGKPLRVTVDHAELLASFLRDRLGLHGTKLSCEAQVCGSCTVLVDGRPVSACCYLAVDVDGRDVLTIEGARGHPLFARIESALLAHQAVQCGFCTPGFVMTLLYLADRPGPRAADDV